MDTRAHEEKTMKALRHCAKDECYACPYRLDPECIKRLTGEAKQMIERLQKLLFENGVKQYETIER